MKTLRFWAVAVAAVLFVAVLETPGYGAKAPKRGGDSGRPARGEESSVEFAVVQIGDERIDVMAMADAIGIKKSIADEDQKRQKAYEAAKKASKNKAKNKGKTAGKGKADLSEPAAQPDAEPLEKPVKRKVTILKDHIKSMPEAEMLREQYLQEGRLEKNFKSKKTPAL